MSQEIEDTTSQKIEDDAIDRKRKWAETLAQNIDNKICIVEEWFANELNHIAALYKSLTGTVQRINIGHIQDLNVLRHVIKDFHRDGGDFETCYFQKDCCGVLCTFHERLSDFVRDNKDLYGLKQVHDDITSVMPKMREASSSTVCESMVRFYLTHAAAQTSRAKEAYEFLTTRPATRDKDDAIPHTVSMTLSRSCLHFGTISRYKTIRDKQKSKNQLNDSSIPQDTMEHSAEVITLLMKVCVAVAEIPKERISSLKDKYAWIQWVVDGDFED